MVRAPINASIPIAYLIALAGAALCAGEVGIIGRRFRHVHPVVMNAIGMGTGTVVLFALSLFRGEHMVAPRRTSTLVALAYLVVLGSCGVFLLYLYILRHWTASATAYEFVLAPIVSALLAAWLLEESITAQVGVGAAIVLAGVYVGVLSAPPEEAIPEPEAQAVVD